MPGRYLCTEESFENFSKTAKAECAQIIIFSFNSNRKFLMNENSFTNVMRISTPLSASVFKGDESDCLLHWFVSTHYRVHSVRLLRKMDNHIITVLNFY